MTDQMRAEELQHIAATVAAQVAHVAAEAAAQVAATAAQAARVLAETTKVDLGYIKQDLEEIKCRLDSKFVSVEAFEPVRRIVYGMIGLILVGVVGGLLALVLKT